MKRKRNKQWFSMLMATAMVMSSISVPVMAAPVDDAMVPVSYTHLTLPTICSV